MICRDIDEKLALLLDPASPASLRDAAEAHLAGCPRCRRLLALARGDVGPALGGEAADLAAQRRADLTSSILRRTTGGRAICDSIDERLCGWVDGTLDAIDSDLVAGHVAHCASCRSIAAALRALSVDLPAMADVEPDVRFVLDVLDRTSRERVEGFDPLAWLERTWAGMFRRPRIAQELAYCAAMILLLLFGTHSREGVRVPPEGQAISARAAGEFTRGAEIFSGFVARAGADLSAGLRAPVVPPEARLFDGGIRRTGARVLTTLDLTWTCGRRVGDGLLHWDTIAIWSAVRDLRESVRKCWREKPAATEPSDVSARIPRQTTQSMDANSGAGPGDGDGIARGGERDGVRRGTDVGKREGDGGRYDEYEPE